MPIILGEDQISNNKRECEINIIKIYQETSIKWKQIRKKINWYKLA